MMTTQLTTNTLLKSNTANVAPKAAAADSTAVTPASLSVETPSSADANTRILPTGSLFDTVGVVLDLSLENRDIMGAYASLDASGRSAFLDMTASLLQQGIVGNETLEVNGQPYTTDITTRLGDPQLMHAKSYGGGRALRFDVLV